MWLQKAWHYFIIDFVDRFRMPLAYKLNYCKPYFLGDIVYRGNTNKQEQT